MRAAVFFFSVDG